MASVLGWVCLVLALVAPCFCARAHQYKAINPYDPSKFEWPEEPPPPPPEPLIEWDKVYNTTFGIVKHIADKYFWPQFISNESIPFNDTCIRVDAYYFSKFMNKNAFYEVIDPSIRHLPFCSFQIPLIIHMIAFYIVFHFFSEACVKILQAFLQKKPDHDKIQDIIEHYNLAQDIYNAFYSIIIAPWSLNLLWFTPRNSPKSALFRDFTDSYDPSYAYACAFSLTYYLHDTIFTIRYMKPVLSKFQLFIHAFRIFLYLLPLNGFGLYYYVLWFSLEIINPLLVLKHFVTDKSLKLVLAYIVPFAYFYFRGLVGLTWYMETFHVILIRLVPSFYYSPILEPIIGKGALRIYIGYFLEFCGFVSLVCLFWRDLNNMLIYLLWSKSIIEYENYFRIFYLTIVFFLSYSFLVIFKWVGIYPGTYAGLLPFELFWRPPVPKLD
jgi:hypothetical protein